MNNDNNDIDLTGTNNAKKETTELERINNEFNGERTEGNIDSLQDDIVRNDTIPETSKDTPGSNGAFPVGAFDTSKD